MLFYTIALVYVSPCSEDLIGKGFLTLVHSRTMNLDIMHTDFYVTYVLVDSATAVQY